MASSSVSDLRIVLIGKNESENSRVENYIKSRSAAAVFDSGASSHVQQTRFSGQKRSIRVFNMPNLLQTHLLQHKVRQTVSECLSQCAPGPHVFILVLQYKDFSEEDRHRVKYILSLFSQKAIEHTVVLTTDELSRTSSTNMRCDSAVHSIITECGKRHLGINERNPGCRSELFTEIERVLTEGHEEFVICNIYRDGGDGSSVDGDPKNSDQKLDGKNKKSTKRGSDGGVISSRKAKLNFVVCGNNLTLKSSVSKVLRGTLNKHINIAENILQKDRNKECVKKDGKIDGRMISVVELPALTRLSEDEVMRETHHCLYLCDPGVDLFLLVTPVTPLTDEDRAEMEKIRRIFSSNEHFMVLFTSEHTVDQRVSEFVLSAESQRIVSLYGSWYSVMGLKGSTNTTQISDLVNYVDNTKTEPYSLHTVIRVRSELEEKLNERDNVQDLQQKINTLESVKLNLVLYGNKALKSSISALILRESRRRSVVSSEFMKRDVDLHGRLISLMEFPALINLSEEEVMRQTLRCVSLCYPGVHLFILIIPDGPLSNEDKAEVEKMQKIFSSRLNKHMMILIQQDSELHTAELSEDTQAVIESFGGRHHFISRNTPVSTLMEKIEQMMEENRREVFSAQIFLEPQMEKLLKYDEMKERIQSLETWYQSQDTGDRAKEVRIVLLGKTGVGKSATGNTILGGEAFISDISQSSVTKECQKQTAEINGRHITVIDTPGLFDTQLSNEEIKREISNCISMILPGPHVFLLLVSLGRFTQEEQESAKIIRENFGENSLNYTIVLFTRGDDLKNKTIDHFLGKADSALKNLIETCENRVHVFNNNQTEDRTQVSDLLIKIEKMVKANGDSYYSCKMFREMERGIQEKQRMILEEKVEQVKREREELTRKHEEDNERMNMMMWEEKQHHNEERMRIEREFREREERHKKDIKEMEEKEAKIQEEIKMEREQRHKDDERRRKKEQEIRDEHEEQIKRINLGMKNEITLLQHYYDKERRRRDEDDQRRRKIDQETWDEYFEKFKRDRQKILQEKEELKLKHEEEKEKTKIKKEEERQKCDKERKRREEEFREEQHKRDIQDIEDYKKIIREEMKREQEEWERQKHLEREEKQKTNNFYKEILAAQYTSNEGASASDPECLRVLLFGRTESGKSATGNTILGEQQFRSEDSKDPVTRVFQKGVREADDRLVSVVDTPALFHLKMSEEQVQQQIMKCVSLSAPGPHVFIIVVSLRKITKYERETINIITTMFGPEAAKFSIVLFTNGDTLKDQTIKEYVKKSQNDNLRNLISDCGNRFLAFNNTETQDRTQVTKLFNMIEELKESNQGRYFTNEMFQEAEVSIDRRIGKLEENKRRHQAQVEELKAKYEKHIRNIKERLEKKKQNTEEEKNRLKNEFVKRAERLRSEFEEKEKAEKKKQELEEQKQADLEEQMIEEYNQRMEKLKREIEDQRKKNEKQQKEQEEEDRKRDEESKRDQEKIKTMEDTIAELLIMNKDEIEKRGSEEQMRKEQEEKKREEWMRKIKEAESDEKEITERQQREREEEKEQKPEEQLRETEEELEKLRKKIEREDRQIKEEKRERQKQEGEETVTKYEKEINEIKKQCDQLQGERKVECDRRKQEDGKRREEKKKRLEKMIEELKQDQEEVIRKRGKEETEIIKEEEEECIAMEQNQGVEMETMRKKIQDETTKQEKELDVFRQRKDQQVQKLKDDITNIYAQETAKWGTWCHIM